MTVIPSAAGSAVRVEVRVGGTVQGVGFRPFVYRLAHELGLAGYVLNDARGVLIEVEGLGAAVQDFLARLRTQAPPLAVLEGVDVVERECQGERGFEILASPHGQAPEAAVTPDTATCEDCLAELKDPADRRFRYPFINCTNCGPRFTIVRGIPYDRPLTTMVGFEMCPSCQAEYDDPGDRRFHAQPNACPRCGPAVALCHPDGEPVSWAGGGDVVAAAAAALRRGQIVALKGIGGYHLACRADLPAAASSLRSRKHREDKPFALMAADLESAERLIALDDPGRELLRSPSRPIVLAARLAGAPVADAVAPGAPELGVMLPYSPLHHLLVSDVGMPLVMTSGNTSDEPIAYQDEDARVRLGPIADLFLVHNREIETRTDDSVARVVNTAETREVAWLRRSRGYVPASLPLPGAGTPRPLLACGAELKNTFCVAKGARAWVSHHIGDLENYSTLRSFLDGIDHFQRLFAVAPEVVAHDLHPEYLSTKYALERDGVELVGVQHHHAHMAACLAEHGELGSAVGAIFDGTGYGLDATVWGGELLYGDLANFRRVGRLRTVAMPGGAQAIKQPWRMACTWLREASAPIPTRLADAVDEEAWGRVTRLAATGFSSPTTSSMGRLFDAVGALCAIRTEINYEGQAAIELEAACGRGDQDGYPIELVASQGLLEIDPRETIRAIARALAGGADVADVASRFHSSIADVTVRACERLASELGTETVVLSGGVFANRRLLEGTAGGLQCAGLRVLMPRRLPSNDGGISYGQAAVAAARMG